MNRSSVSSWSGICAAAHAIVLASLAGVAAGAEPGVLSGAAGQIPGALVPVGEAGPDGRETLCWKSPLFADPHEFFLDEISTVTFGAADEAAADPAGDVLVQVRGGDMVVGTIESIDATHVVVAKGAGRPALRIARGEIERIVRRGVAATAFHGPGGLRGWDVAPADAWREEAGRIMAAKVGATAVRDVARPPRARYEFVLSWKRQPEFRLSVAAADKPDQDGYYVESFPGEAGAATLMLVRRSGGKAALEPLPIAGPLGDTLRIVVFVDQELGRLAAIVPGGADGKNAAAEVVLKPVGERPSGRVRVALKSQDLCLESLRATAWQAAEPALDDGGASAVVTRDGALPDAVLEGFDAGAGEFVFRRAGQALRLPLDAVNEIVLPAPPPGDAQPATLRLSLRSGDVLSGRLVKIDDDAVWLRHRGIDEPVAMQRGEILTLTSLQAARGRRPLPTRTGSLLIGENSIRGCLAAAAGPGGLGWQPLGSAGASGFAAPGDGAFAATVEYVPARPRRPEFEVDVGGIGGMVSRDDDGFSVVVMLTDDGAAARDGRLQPGDRILAIAPVPGARFVETADLENETVTHLLRGRVGTKVRLQVQDAVGNEPRVLELVRGPINVAGKELLDLALAAHERLAGAREVAEDRGAGFPSLVILRSGDVAPCNVTRIDGRIVELQTPLAADAGAAPIKVESRFVRAVELQRTAASRKISKSAFERLMTVPRMQRDRPPTHVLRLANGDYLRGRLVSLDADTLEIDVLGDVKKLPRAQVARIIWLHPEQPAGAADGRLAEPVDAPAGSLLVQGISADERRTTLFAERIDGSRVLGRSQAFGETGIDMDAVESILVGTAVGRDDGELPYAKWQLKPAPEPRALRDAAKAGPG